MEGPIIGALVSSTLPMLYKSIEERRNTLMELDADVQSIELELGYIRSEIQEFRKRSPKEMTDYQQRTKINDMRRMAQEIEDFVEGLLPSPGAKKVNLDQFEEKIKQLIRKLEYMRERIKNYGKDSASSPIKKDSASSSGSSGSPSSPDLCMADPELDKLMDEPLKELQALMKETESRSGGDLKVISIVGFGGMGKALLARKVYNSVKDQYRLHTFVRATGKDEKATRQEIFQELQKKHIECSHGASSTSKAAEQREPMCAAGTSDFSSVPQIKTDKSNSIEEKGKSICIEENISGKSNSIEEKMTSKSAEEHMKSDVLPTNRYLIVVDDVQTEQLAIDITSAFREIQNKLDSRIIVTTTIQSVAARCSSSDGHVYKIRALNEEQSKRLFFGDEQRSDAMMDSIAEWKKCDGVALALLSLRKYCDGDLGKCGEAWNKLYTAGGEKTILEQMKKVLDHSYVSLPNLVVQDCLLYTSMFPRGHHIRRGSLVRQWLAEGLALEGDGSDDEGSITGPADVAAGNLKTLVDRNVIWPIKVGINEDIKTAKPPGVMLDYIVRRSRQDKFFMVHRGDGTTGKSQDIRRLSLHHTNHLQLLRENLLRLRTLAVFNDGSCDELSFDRCLQLRVLDLETCPGLNKSHLDQICELLRKLRYLSVGAGITVIPRRIAWLEWLETLHTGKKTVVTVPAELLELPYLKHLIGKLKLHSRDSGKRNLDKFLSKESKLEMLAGFVPGKDGGGFLRLICHMSRLRKLKIWLDCQAIGRNMTEQLSHGLKGFLGNKPDGKGRSLSIDFRHCTESFLGRLGSPSGNLSSLKLRGGDLSKMHDFVQNILGIEKVCLSSAELDWQHVVDGTRSFGVLKYLKLEADSAIISTQLQGSDAASTQQQGDTAALVVQQADQQFNSLERICLVARNRLPKLTIQSGALKWLIGLHLICEDLDDQSANQIIELNKLREVALHSGIKNEVKDQWKKAALGHPRRPNVVFVGVPSPRSEEGTAQPSSGASNTAEATPGLQQDQPAGQSTEAPNQLPAQLSRGSSSHQNEDQALPSTSNQQENNVAPPTAQPSSEATITDEATPGLQQDQTAGPSTVAPSQLAQKLSQGSSNHQNEDHALQSTSTQQENNVPPPIAGSSHSDHTPPTTIARHALLPGSSNNDNQSKPRKRLTTWRITLGRLFGRRAVARK